MKVLPFLGRVAPAAIFTVLTAAVAAQSLPRPSLNKASAGHAFTLGTAPAKPAHTDGGTCAPDGLCLAVTLALAAPGNPDLCGTDTQLDVSAGDQVNVCYTVTNHSATTLNYHTLSDDHVGQLLGNENVAIAAGGTYRYNRTIVASPSPGHDNGTFTSTWTGTDVLPGYAFDAAAPYAFVDVSASGTALTLSDDGASAISMPFPFAFYGATSSDLCVGNNGGLYFGVSSCTAFPYNNTALPSNGLNKPAILPYWDDLMANGTVYYASVGSAPNRQFVVEYQNKFVYGDSGNPSGQTGATFEVIFNETGGGILFQYQTAGFGGAGASYDNGVSATVGLQHDASLANQYSYNTASLHDGLAIAWTPTHPATYTATATATLNVGAPGLSTTPDAATGFAPTVAAGSHASAPLLIDNVGNRDLVWSLTPPAPNAHFPKTPRTVSTRFHGAWDGIGVSPDSVRRSRKTKSGAPADAASIPVYATEVTASGANYVSFDAADPSTSNVILANSPTLFGITFVDGDFSKQYGVDYFAGDLYAISTLDGSSSVIGNTGLVSCCMVIPGGMRWDATSGTTYLVIDNFTTQTSALYTIDLATAATTLVGPLTGVIRDITFDRSGLMYGIDSANDVLVAIDKSNADTQVIGSLGFDAVFGQGLDFDLETGVLYLASADETTKTMYVVDPQTGTANAVSGMESEVDSMAIAKSGVVCATPASAPWLSYDVASGTVAADPDQTHPATVHLGFDASGLAPGSYSANLCIYTNDLAHSRVAIPVNLTVTAGGPADTIFADGFDGSGSGGGTTPLAQTAASTPLAQNSAACGDNTAGTTADNQYWRRYYLGEYKLSSPAHVSSVDVSVEKTTGAPDVKITLYTIPHSVAVDTIDTAQLTQIGTATAAAPADATLTSFNVPVSGTVTDAVASDLVVEVSTEDVSAAGQAFYIGSTNAAETHPSFLSSTACSLAAPTPTAAIGFPNMHIIQTVNVDR